MVKSLMLILVNILIGSLGQLLFKRGMLQVGRIGLRQ